MAKGAQKKKFKFKLKIDILKSKAVDLQKESVEYLTSNKEAAKFIKPLEFEVDAELDEKKWNERKIEDEAFGAIRVPIKFFDQDVKKAKAKDDPKLVKSAFDKLSKNASEGFEEWLKAQESGKADNAKALGDGRKAMAKLEAIDFKGAFDGPRTKALDALKPLTGARPDMKKAPQISKQIEAIRDQFEAVGAEAEAAIRFLLDAAKKQSRDDAVDAELVKFYLEVRQGEKVYEPFLKGCQALQGALDEAIQLTATEQVDPRGLKKTTDTLTRLSSLDRAGSAAVNLAKQLVPKFKKIESKLK